MTKKKNFPTHPKHPERICWGCDKYCSVHALGCGNGADRTQHPVELFGDDWMEWELKSDRIINQSEEEEEKEDTSS